MRMTYRFLALASAAALLGAAGPDNFDIQSQIGPNPVLPAPQQYLFPPMHLARWSVGKPARCRACRPGCACRRWRPGSNIPRSVYTLPNGDVLIVESRSPDLDPTTRPKTSS